MNPLLLDAGSPAHTAVTGWVDRAEATHHVRILFAGVYGSRPMGMATALSDEDLFAVHAIPEAPRLILTLENGRRTCDVLSWNIEAVRLQRPASAGYPSYHMRSDEQQAARKHLPPVIEPENHVTELLLCRHVWDDRGHLRDDWPVFRHTYLNTLHVLDLLYSKARGLMDHYLLGPKVPTRRYLNAVHRVLGMRWILEKNSVPPINFEALLRSADEALVRDICLPLLQTYQTSNKGKEAMVATDPVLHDYLVRQLVELAAAIRLLSMTGPERTLGVE